MSSSVSSPDSASPSSSAPCTLLDLLADIEATADDIVSLAGVSDVITLTQFAALINRLPSALYGLDEHDRPEDNGDVDNEAVELRRAVGSLQTELRRARHVVTKAANSSPAAVRRVENAARAVARSLGVVMLSCANGKEAIGALYREMMGCRFDLPPPPLARPSQAAAAAGMPDLEDLVVRVKAGEEGGELEEALEELEDRVREGLVGEKKGRLVVPVLLNRLRSGESGSSSKMVALLRRLASGSDDNKEIMADTGALSIIVHLLAGDTDESREAVGLLLGLSNISKVRQRIGRVQGCIEMLVSLFRGNDSIASLDAEKLLHSLSSNTQNVLLMAEAGYFSPMVHYLKEGSDMNKILMATAIARMELTDQMKDALGKEGSIEPLVDMFTSGKLEAKQSSLSALQKLSTSTDNVHLLINAGIVDPLLQLLFSVTSVLMTIREPAAAILACVAQSELVLIKKDIGQQMLSLLNLSSPVIQYHLLQAVTSIASYPSASKVRAKMRRNGAVQLIQPFLTEKNDKIRLAALKLLYIFSKDLPGDLTEQIGETHLKVLLDIFSASTSEDEKATAAGILSNLPVTDKKTMEIFKKSNLLHILVSILSAHVTAASTALSEFLLESILGIVIRFTAFSDKKLQRVSVEHGIMPLLVKLLSCGSPIVQSRAATSLTQLSQSSLSLSKSKASRWLCLPPSSEAFCVVHNYKCTVKSTFCLVKCEALPPLIQILRDQEREADEAVLNALSTLMQDEIWENGSAAIDKASGVEALIGVLEVGTTKAKEKALWMLERIFRIESYRQKYGEAAQVLLTELAQNRDRKLKPIVVKILRHLQLPHNPDTDVMS